MQNLIAKLKTALADRYLLERELGQGGMATVYLARDLKHDREVAVKVLRPELAAVIGAERFLAEIRVTANLQHPHILPLFDSGAARLSHPERSEGPLEFLYYVMPYVEGESLRERLTREKQLPIDDAVRIAREVASALDYAHRHNVVHRDIKPENILLHDGQALVADFGIALAVSSAGGTRMTETGMSLGTPHYMSPEQAMGEREINARSDVYALGCVLYEMLVGEPPFTGPTAQAIVAKVVTEHPRPLLPQRHTVPPHVEAAVLTALEKLPADRFASAAEFGDALAGATARPHRGTSARGVDTPPPSFRPSALLPWAAGAAALVLGLLAGRLTRTGEPPAPVVRFVISTTSDQPLSTVPVGTVALSPDGTSLVYVGQSAKGLQLYLRRLSELTASPIPGTESGVSPIFSPDGQWIAFFVGTSGTLKKVPLAGGTALAIPTGSQSLQAAVWLDDRTLIVCGTNGALARLNGDGSATVLSPPDSALGETALLPTSVLPGGHVVLAVAVNQGNAVSRAVAVDLRSGKHKVLLEGITGVGYDRGYLTWVQPDGSLLAAPFDAGRLAITGSPIAIAQGTRVPVGGVPQFTLSHSGSLAYVPELPFDLVVVDRAGKWRAVTEVQRRFHSPRFSPDGRRIAVDFSQQGSRDVWMLDLQQHSLSRLTFDNTGHDPVWTPDGRRIAYLHVQGGAIGIFLRNADGSGSVDSLLVATSNLTAGSFSRDGKTLVVVGTGKGGDYDLDTVSLGTDRKALPFLATSFNEGWPALSPDGRWLAYQSDESGQTEVYVRDFRGAGAKIIVSQNGGAEPVWSRDGRELFYRGFGPQGRLLVAVALQTAPEFRVVSRTPLFDLAGYEGATPHANFDVAPDGKSFVMVHPGQLSEIVIVQNWTEDARRRSEGGK
ncbi:MAG: protein kinase domain-containing protein [Gemmatimonadales bacterium]